MARIALVSDVARLVGEFADEVENRSLLLDKFIFHKRWNNTPKPGFPDKWDDALRWSFMRLSAEGVAQLKAESIKLRAEANRAQTEEKRDKLFDHAAITERMSKVAQPSPDIADLRARHTRRFLSLFEKGQAGRGKILIGKLEGRLAINLADGLVQNANICLDRLLGLPYIPGSAIKGVCRHTALEEVREANDADHRRLLDLFIRIFGVTENDFGKEGALHTLKGDLAPHDRKGAIAFLPAWPVDATKIVVDLTNVHTPNYYRTGLTEDLAIEKPQPNPFPTVEAGARFAFAIVLNGMDEAPALLQQAEAWLRSALTVRGLGAKTAAGYGWFSIDEAAAKKLADATRADETKAAQETATRQQAEAQRQAAEAQAKAEAERLDSLSPEDRAMATQLLLSDQHFADLVKTLTGKVEVEQRACIRLLRENKTKRERWKTWKRNDKKELISAVEQVIETLKLQPLA